MIVAAIAEPEWNYAVSGILLIFALMIVSVLFVLGETAVELIRPMHVRHFKENDEQSRRLQRILDNQQKYATACNLGVRLARLGMIVCIMWLAYTYSQHVVGLGRTVEPMLFLQHAVIVGVPVMLLNLVVGELIPKSYATLHPHNIGIRLYKFIRAACFLLSVPATMLVGLAGIFTTRFGGRPSLVGTNQAEEEIKSLVDTAQETGEIEADEQELLHSVFEFTDTVAREVMTPRVDLDALPLKCDPNDLVKVIEETGHSRIPVYEDTDDQIVGIIHAKDLLLAMARSNEPPCIRELMRPAAFIPENKNLNELLAEMKASRNHLAVVQDEFGGTAGIVTLEDIIEELVGDIVDEYDEEEPDVVKEQDGYLVEGKTHLDDVNHEIGSEFESEEFDTIGGYVFGLFGRQPKPQESIAEDGYLFTVADTDGRRLLKIRIQKIQEPAEEETGS